MKKNITFISLCLMLIFSVLQTHAIENTTSEDFVITESTTIATPTIQQEDETATDSAAPEKEAESETLLPCADNIKITITACPDSVYLGDKLSVSVSISYKGEPTSCGAVWMFNKNPIHGFSNDRFMLEDGKTSTLNWNITEEWRGWGSMEVSFMLYAKDMELGIVSQAFSIIDIKNDDILAIVQPVKVEATVAYNTSFYSDVMLKNKIGTVSANTKCQVLNSKSDYSNQILTEDGRQGWVSLSSLNISKKNYTKNQDFTNEQKNLFVNKKNYKSKTDYLVWVNLETQKVNVFLKKEGNWVLERVFSCASGKNATPTINGVFIYSELLNRWTYEHYYVGPVMIFSGNYAIHSVLMNYDNTIYDGTIGRPASNGCVRMLQPDVEWLVDYVPFGTTVVVY